MPPRKPIADLIGELQSWLPNYDHKANGYPTLLWRILASAPGGERAEDMGYEPFNLGWQELDQLGRVLVAIQDKRDVEDIVRALLADEEEGGGEVDEARRNPMVRATVRESRRSYSMTYGTLPSFDRFIVDIRRPDPDYEDGRPYWPESTTYRMELVDSHEVDLANEFGGLRSFSSRYSHKVGFKGDDRSIYDFLTFLIDKWNDGDEAAGDLASSIMTTLGYEWI